MHGWGGSGGESLWNPVLQHLSIDNVRFVLVDLRGHGLSGHAESGFTTEQFAEDMFEVADRFGAAELILIAYSMSGRWAQWMSQARPERVIGQLLIAPAPAAALPLTEDMLDDWIQGTRTRNAFDLWVRKFTKNPLSHEILTDYFASVEGTPENSLRATFRMCCEPGFSEKLAATRAATVVVGGIHDAMMSPDYLRAEVVQKIPGARLALLDCAHEVPMEKPLETAAIIEAFIAPLVV